MRAAIVIARGSLPARRRMQGLSLIELMIAITISLIVLAGVGWVYLGTVQTYRTHDGLSRMQEGARYAFEIIGKDLRMAGTTGCPFQTSTNVLTTPSDWYKDLFNKPISSADKDDVAGGVVKYSDALRVLRADLSREYIVSSHDAGTATFTLTANHDITDGQLMVVTDCDHAAVFQARNPSANLVYHTEGGTPGNTVKDLGNGGAITYGSGSRLYKLSAVTYYVALNAAGVPSLFRQVPLGSTATLTAQELVEGVEDLQVSFGVDTTSPNPDGQADWYTSETAGVPYVTGTWIETKIDTALGDTPKKRWDRVVSVRISLLMRTVEDRVVPVKQKYDYNGTKNIVAPDLRLRKVFTHVINLRNRS